MANHNRNLELDPATLASPDSNKKLIHLSRKVLECVRRSQQTTGNTIAKEIIRDIPTTLSEVDFKNVQRRVYDALNVLHALKIISKVRNEIKYQGGISGQNVEGLKLHAKHLRVIVEAKRANLSEKFLHFVALQRLVKRNQEGQSKPLAYVPCVVGRVASKVRVSVDEGKMAVTSAEPFTLFNDIQLLARLKLHEVSQAYLEATFPREILRLLAGEKPEVANVLGPLFVPSPIKSAVMDYRMMFLQSFPLKELAFCLCTDIFQ